MRGVVHAVLVQLAQQRLEAWEVQKLGFLRVDVSFAFGVPIELQVHIFDPFVQTRVRLHNTARLEYL